jgi:hypothetical protein
MLRFMFHASTLSLWQTQQYSAGGSEFRAVNVVFIPVFVSAGAPHKLDHPRPLQRVRHAMGQRLTLIHCSAQRKHFLRHELGGGLGGFSGKIKRG